MPPNLQDSKLHKKLKFNGFILVRFSVFVFWWQENGFRIGLKTLRKMKKYVNDLVPGDVIHPAEFIKDEMEFAV